MSLILRTGLGLDVHRFCELREFWLGGVLIPYEKGLVGHSDADALTHALMDAMLGAAGLNDIGHYFPDSDLQWKNANSIEMLKITNNLIAKKGYAISNIDCVICLEKPKIAEYIPAMKNCFAKALTVSLDDISIKATSFEKLGFIGSEEGILSMANVLLYKN